MPKYEGKQNLSFLSFPSAPSVFVGSMLIERSEKSGLNLHETSAAQQRFPQVGQNSTCC